jgi:glucosamine-6-phosphate deaminase
MAAKSVMLIVNGYNKARALRHGVEGGISQMWTISALQMHEKAIIIADEDACAELKVGTYKYFKDIEGANLNPDTLL